MRGKSADFGSSLSGREGEQRSSSTEAIGTRTHEQSHALPDLYAVVALDAAPRIVELCLDRDPPLGRLVGVLLSQDVELFCCQGRLGVHRGCFVTVSPSAVELEGLPR